MKLPRKTKQWAKEAAKALEYAFGLAMVKHGELNNDAKENLYRYGPSICAKNRDIKDEDKLEEAAIYAFEGRLNDFQIEPDSIKNYSINFFLSYLDVHVALEFITENKVHDIMEYLLENYEIPN
jgi:hypothetical protein